MSRSDVISYSPTGRASCKGCGRYIQEGALRVGVSERSNWHDGFDVLYYHLKCTYKSGSVESLVGFHDLRWADQLKVMEHRRVPPPDESKEDVKQAKAANEKLWELIDQLESNVPNKLLKSILQTNDISVEGLKPPEILRRVAEAMQLGRLPPCVTCKNRTLVLQGGELVCTGWFSGATKCLYKTRENLPREAIRMPIEASKNPFLASWQPPEGQQVTGEQPKEGGSAEDPFVASEDEPDHQVPAGKELLGMKFAFIGNGSTPRERLKEIIESHGGQHQDELTDESTHLIAPESEVKKRSKSARIKQAKTQNIPVVKEDFVLHLAAREGPGLKLRQRKHIGDYKLFGGDGTKIPPVKHLLQKEKDTDNAMDTSTVAEPLSGKKRKKNGKGKTKEEPTTESAAKKPKVSRPKVEPGSAILKLDPKVPRQEGNILVTDDGTVAWHAMLHQTDLQTGVNKFYVIQAVELGKSVYLFTRWGRVGGGGGFGYYNKEYKFDRFGTAEGAIKAFRAKFTQCTGLDWDDRDNFVQQPGRYHMIELQSTADGAVQEKKDSQESASSQSQSQSRMQIDSKLDPRLQSFVHMIFDQNMMNQAMRQANLDLKKMPLGSLSKKQMESGYSILREIQDILETESNLEDLRVVTLLTDASTRFYTVIPHQFPPFLPPPVIKSQEMLKQKIEIIESLLDISIANSLLKQKESDSEHHPDDAHYLSLKCKLEPVDKTSADYSLVEEYMRNTHAATHDSYKLELIDLFTVEREGEADRFQPFSDLHNRRLLWHGSRLTNWVGILSQGLRIAPPEAPVTGYMFDKGVYFADMVSKSANYCFTSPSQNEGVLLLCEVALGDMHELTSAQYHAATLSKAAGKHSTFGQGKTCPDPAESVKIFDDVLVPKGKGVDSNVAGSSLLYNEFIVYDVSQVRARYLLRTRFNYK